MSADVQPKPVKRVPWIRRLLSYAIVLVVGFLAGFVPMWFMYSAAQRQLTPVKIESALATAVIGAQRSDYKTALQAASDFFTLLRAETDKGNASLLSPAQREGVQPLFAQQDEIVALLARGDSASAGRLSALYEAYRKTMSK